MKKENFFRRKLKNGMTVIFEQRKNSGVVSLAFCVKQGGVYEKENEKGISHFIEHMVFKGTKTRNSKQISEEIEKNGGILNAFTEEEFTSFTCKIPSNKLLVGLDVLSDLVKNPLFDEQELNKERQVIMEEIKMRKDRPDVYVSDKLTGLLYSGNFGMDLIGTEKSLLSIDKNIITNKFKEAYRPSNMFLCVVGDCEFKVLCEYCENSFESAGIKLIEPRVQLKNAKKIEKRAGLDQANMIFAFHSPRASEKDYFAAQVLNCVMIGGMSSRLWQEIREKRNLAYAVRGGYNGGKYFGYNFILVGCSAENVEKIKELILIEFKKVENLDKKEFQEAKEQLIGNSKISREDSQGQMLDLIYNEIWDSAERSYDYEEGIKKVDINNLKKLAHIKEYSFLALMPGDKD